ncbi:MAG: alpha/beta fold hydrolase [Gammaproteobacteria bacterium]|jgi:esterase/lipase superfamily enzyme|nr:alpha/beta fold hydrolase [Gammaproteobacteria bacterium]
MVRIKRRLKIVLVSALVILLAVGAWLYYVVYLSTGSAIERAEGLLFRRMQVTRVDDQGTHRFFFVTNRRLNEANGDLEQKFDNQREDILKFGYFDSSLEPDLGLGIIFNPAEWFQIEQTRIRDVQPLESSAFVEQLQKYVQASPRRALLLVVHGFREQFPSALHKTAFLGHQLDIDTPVMVFDWPGNQGSTLRGYRRAREVAKQSGVDLARAMALIIDEVRPERLWLVANSMGAQVVADAFSVLYRQARFSDTETEIEDVVLTAPDVGHEDFDTNFKPKINALVKDLTVYVSSNDRALVMSRLINRERRRGESTLGAEHFEEAVKIAEFIEPNSQRITMVDVTPVNRTRNFHNFSLETPEYFDDLYLRLTNADTPSSRLLYSTRNSDGKTYWVITRSR